MRRQEIHAVTFDVGGTLIRPHPSVGAIYARFAMDHGLPPGSVEVLDQRFREIWQQCQPFDHTRQNWARLVDAVFGDLVRVRPSEAFFDDLYDAFGRASAWRIYPDAIPTLEALAGQGLDLGIISNWDDRLRPLLRELRLDRYFNSIVISCEAGFAKPSSVIFEEALRQIGRPGPCVVHVGDGLREDFAGAMAAGFEALHLRRDAPSRDLQIQSLSELPEWLTSREHSRRNFLLRDD